MIILTVVSENTYFPSLLMVSVFPLSSVVSQPGSDYRVKQAKHHTLVQENRGSSTFVSDIRPDMIGTQMPTYAWNHPGGDTTVGTTFKITLTVKDGIHMMKQFKLLN